MYGYVLPASESLTRNDRLMFQSLYCGTCISIKNSYGNMPRLTTNYDITVFGLIAIEALKPQLEFEAKSCIANPRKKGIVKDCEFMQRLAAVNILLAYYKACDDVIDSGGKKKLVRRILKKPRQKAMELMPETDRIISNGYARLRALEKENCENIDRVSDCFASLLAELIGNFIKGKEGEAIADAEFDNFYRMCYNIGKFVYIADALDDIDSDAKDGCYNPFLAKYKDYKRGRRQEFMQAHGDEVKFLFNSTVNRAIECSNAITFTHVNDLLRNILYHGLRKKAEQLMNAEKQLPPPRL